jgi:hypothetical protein
MAGKRGRSGRGLSASMLDKPIFWRLSEAEKLKVLELARIVDPELNVNRGGAITNKAKTKSVRYSKGGYSKPHNYFAGGNVTNNLKSR